MGYVVSRDYKVKRQAESNETRYKETHREKKGIKKTELYLGIISSNVFQPTAIQFQLSTTKVCLISGRLDFDFWNIAS